MFGIGTPEMVAIILIIFFIYGPEEMPHMIKKVVGYMRKVKDVSDEITNTVSKEIHRIEQSTEIKEAKNMIEQIKEPIKNIQEPLPKKEKKEDGTPPTVA